MVHCKDCGKSISQAASVCPHCGAKKIKKSQHADLIAAGVWIWGAVTIVFSSACLGIIIASGLHVGIDGKFLHDTPQWVAGMYFVLKEAGALVGGLLGFSALAWSHFFNKQDSF